MFITDNSYILDTIKNDEIFLFPFSPTYQILNEVNIENINIPLSGFAKKNRRS